MQISEALRAANGGAIYRPWGNGCGNLIVKPETKSRYALMDCGVRYRNEEKNALHRSWSPSFDDLIADDWELLEEGAHINGEG